MGNDIRNGDCSGLEIDPGPKPHRKKNNSETRAELVKREGALDIL